MSSKEETVKSIWDNKKTRARNFFPVLLIMTATAFIMITHLPSGATAKEKTVSKESMTLLGQLSDAIADVAETAKPAVVNISTTSTVTMEQNPFGDMYSDPFFRRFFGDQFDHGQKRKYKSSALGSGVIVSEDGYILTNNHVVKDADEIKVNLFDKREFKGKVVGSDPRTDLAVIKIDARDLPLLRIGQSGTLKTGDIVLAIGNPFGLNQTITMGIVSAVGRSNIGLADLEDFIQTDAAINPGNSGGALINSSGELVGINTAIFSTSGGYMGIGFAIPMDMARSVMDSIIKTGKVVRGWLGVSIQDLTGDLAASLGIKETGGALISGVEKGGPADKAGLKRGDLIAEVNGKKVEDSTGLRNRISATAPGTKVDVGIIREGKKQAVSVTLGEYNEKKTAKKSEYDNVLKGVSVQELTESLRQKMDIPANVEGVVVTGVSPELRDQGLLRANDVIQEVNRAAIQDVQDFEKAVGKVGEKDTVLLLLYRSGGSIYVTIRP